MNKLTLTYKDSYTDGGTQEWVTPDGAKYYLDFRLQSPTMGALYDHYPKEGSLPVECEVEFHVPSGKSSYILNHFKRHSQEIVKHCGKNNKVLEVNLSK